jgi:hypothetical protein
MNKLNDRAVQYDHDFLFRRRTAMTKVAYNIYVC